MSVTGKKQGWIKARFLPLDVVSVDLTALPEYANTRTVEIEVTDLDGNPVDNVVSLECELFTQNGIEVLAASFTLAENGAGTEITTTENARLFIVTSTTGRASLLVKDVSGSFIGNVYLKVTPLNVVGANAMIKLAFA